MSKIDTNPDSAAKTTLRVTEIFNEHQWLVHRRTDRMEVVAEGIETVMQLDQLRALNCEQGQGYYFSRPVDAESATELIRRDERGEILGTLERGSGMRSAA